MTLTSWVVLWVKPVGGGICKIGGLTQLPPHPKPLILGMPPSWGFTTLHVTLFTSFFWTLLIFACYIKLWQDKLTLFDVTLNKQLTIVSNLIESCMQKIDSSVYQWFWREQTTVINPILKLVQSTTIEKKLTFKSIHKITSPTMMILIIKLSDIDILIFKNNNELETQYRLECLNYIF